jgi:hypothetical protein
MHYLFWGQIIVSSAFHYKSKTDADQLLECLSSIYVALDLIPAPQKMKLRKSKTVLFNILLNYSM